MKYFIVFLLLVFGLETRAQNQNDFEIQIKIKSTALKDQQSSGTCWSFATTSFIETEALRLGKDTITISPIFYVSPTYIKKLKSLLKKKAKAGLRLEI